MTNTTRGYSLLELIISVSMLALLLAIATPSFASVIHQSKIKATASTLSQSLYLARSSAIGQARTVLVCQIANSEGTTCVDKPKRNKNWRFGWLVYTDMNGNNTLDQDDEILFQYQPDQQTAVVFNQNGHLRFFANGSARSAGFYICGPESTRLTHIKLLHSGRTRTTTNDSEKRLQTCLNSFKKTE